MNSKTLERLRAESLRLPELERAALAHELVASLDAPADPGAAVAWDAEITRRLAALDAGTAQTIDRDEFRRRLRARRAAN